MRKAFQNHSNANLVNKFYCKQKKAEFILKQTQPLNN